MSKQVLAVVDAKGDFVKMIGLVMSIQSSGNKPATFVPSGYIEQALQLTSGRISIDSQFGVIAYDMRKLRDGTREMNTRLKVFGEGNLPKRSELIQPNDRHLTAAIRGSILSPIAT